MLSGCDEAETLAVGHCFSCEGLTGRFQAPGRHEAYDLGHSIDGERRRLDRHHPDPSANQTTCPLPKAALDTRLSKALETRTHPVFFVRSQREGTLQLREQSSSSLRARYKYLFSTHQQTKNRCLSICLLTSVQVAFLRQRSAKTPKLRHHVLPGPPLTIRIRIDCTGDRQLHR